MKCRGNSKRVNQQNFASKFLRQHYLHQVGGYNLSTMAPLSNTSANIKNLFVKTNSMNQRE